MKRSYHLPILFRQQIVDYSWDGVVAGILEPYRLSDILVELNALLKHVRPPMIVQTLNFVRDCAQFNHPRVVGFRKRLSASKEFWETMRTLLQAPNSEVRNNAIYTIGKLSLRGKASLLKEAFPWFLRHDPINLGGLIFEWKWLTRRWPQAWVDQIGHSQNYLVRWSLCEHTYNQSCHPPEAKKQLAEFYTMLSNEPHPWVAAEARYCLAVREAEQRFAKRPKHLEPPSMQTFDALAEHFRRGSKAGMLPAFDRYVRGQMENQ